MKTTGSIFDYIQLGLIASGGDPNGKGANKGDFPSDKSSNQKVILPMLHNPDGVKQEHLAFSPLMHSPTALSHMSFQGHMDPGAMVYFLKMPGESGGIILGQANDQVNYDQGMSGGQNLLGHQYFQDLFNRETGINIPPDIQETTEDGVKVKAIKEKGKKHKHALLKGLHSHNALQPTTGYKLEEIQEVPTAKQHFDAIPNTDMLSQLPGDIASLGGMFQGLMGGLFSGGGGSGGSGGSGAGAGAGAGVATTTPTVTANTSNAEFSLSFLESNTSNTIIISNVGMGAGIGANSGQVTVDGETPMHRIEKELKPEIFQALSSLSVLTQGSATADAASFITSGRVHTPTYLANAEDLLKQVTTIEDLFVVLHRLQHDATLFGLENLADQLIEIETAWGNANVIISYAGDIGLEYANSNVETKFVESMSSPMSSPSTGGSGAGGGGSGGGGNMFGKSSQIMQDMFKRLPPNNQKESKNMHEKLNQEDESQKLWKFVEKTINGGNPLDILHFKG